MPDPRAERQARLRERLDGEGLAGLIIVHAPNVRYLTGFTGSAGVVLMRSDGASLVTDARYEAQAPQEAGSHARVLVVQNDLWERVRRDLDRGPGRRGADWGFECEYLPVDTARKLADLGLSALRPVKGLVEDLRVRKSREEVGSIREAARLASDAFAAALPVIRPGIRERDIAAALELELRRRGSEWHPFPTIVASGPRSALPHASTSDRPVAVGDLVLVDFGARVDGYCADLTRMVVAGRADERQRAMHGLVREAQQRALEGLRAGMTGRQGDGLARQVIEARGFGDAFGHSLGHGLGLEVHEGPRLSRSSEETLPVDSVVTVEPGVYFPGWGGIRLEDDVRLGADGAELLSDGRTELVETAG